jgi:hypothetical protein
MTQPCDCCEGPVVLTPATTGNRPGLSKLAYRVGTHATFFETMQARLSSPAYPALRALKTRERSDPAIALLDAWATVADVLTFYQERIANEGYLRTATERRSVLELARLVGYALRPGVAASVYLAYSLDKDAAPTTIPKGAQASSVPAPGEQMQTFETSEPLDARVEWNAIKPRLTRPQVFEKPEIDDNIEQLKKDGLYLKGIATKLKANDPLIVKFSATGTPVLAYVKSVTADSTNDRTHVTLVVPAQGQTIAAALDDTVAKFSRVEDFNVSPDAAMTRRVLDRLQRVRAIAAGAPNRLAAELDDALQQLAGDAAEARDRRYTNLQPWIEKLHTELAAARELLTDKAVETSISTNKDKNGISILENIVTTLNTAPSTPPSSAQQLPRSPDNVIRAGADAVPRLLTTMRPNLADVLYESWKNVPPAKTPELEVYALRVDARPFGHNAPLKVDFDKNSKLPQTNEWNINDSDCHKSNIIFLDNEYEIPYPREQKPSNTFVVIDRAPPVVPPVIGAAPVPEQAARRVIIAELDQAPVHRSLVAYGLSGKTVQITLPTNPGAWLVDRETFAVVRDARVFAGSEKLELAEAPIAESIGKYENKDGSRCEIELDGLYDKLQPGRWVIVAGERVLGPKDKPVHGVTAAELAMIAAVRQDQRKYPPQPKDSTDQQPQNEGPLPGEKYHTFITLADPCLAFTYKRDTVTIYGNVVEATHGETRREVLGGGDAAKTLQTFALKQSPLTFVSAATVSGVDSTLEVRVNDVQWHEAESLAALGAKDRKFLTRTGDDGKTSVVFGDGERGVRLPTGIENVKATYRSGIGKPGNVKAEQITMLGTRPLGVKEVTNPIRASAGADRESRDQARENTPIALLALDRLVSVSDYADFSRTFAGIGKAAAWHDPEERQQVVRVVIAGADDIPIDDTSDLYRNLYAALHRFGDPYLPITVGVRKLLALVISAKVKVDPDYQWETLEPKVRAAVLDRFSFARMDLGQPAFLSDAIDAIQAVRGVVYVDVDVFTAADEDKLDEGFTQQTVLDLTLEALPRIAVASDQIAYLVADVPDTLILQEIKS